MAFSFIKLILFRHRRLRAVSLLLENKRDCERDCERVIRAAKPRAASSAGVGRRAKRETALVSYNDLDATLTGRIMCTLPPTPNFEYDIPVSNDFSQVTGFICKMR